MGSNKNLNIDDIPKILKATNFEDKYKNLEKGILFLGETGKGKSSLVELLRGNSELCSEGSNGQFSIVDKNGRISGRESTILSHTTFPEPVSYKGLGADTKILDLPGFEDTRSSVMDILCSVFTAEALKCCRSVKLVLVVSYDDVKEGGDRKGFTTLVKLLTEFTQSLDKFKESIALFVTKVPNLYVSNDDDQPILVKDEEMKNHIQSFLLNVKTTISSDKDVACEKKNIYKNAVKLIDIILPMVGKTYDTSRIGIFRCPRKMGPIALMQPFQESKANLHKIIQDRLNFTTIHSSDFKCTISPDSKIYVDQFIQNVVEESSQNIQCILEEIEKHHESRENMSTDIEVLAEEFCRVNRIWQDSAKQMQNLKYITDYLEHFVKFLNSMFSGTKLAQTLPFKTIITDLGQTTKLVGFLERVSNRKFNISTQKWMQLFNGVGVKVDNTNTWYAALLNIAKLSATYAVQSKQDARVRSTYFETLNKWASSDKQVLIPGKDVQDSILKIIKTNIGYHLNFGISLTKLQHLLNLSKYAFEETLTTLKGDKCQVKGHFVVLGNINFELKKMNTLEILATCKVFIDRDIDATGQELHIVIIAPVWEVVGEPRTLHLDGKDGQPYEGSAICNFPGTKGANGEPGRPGGCSGSFIGIGEEIISGDKLTISANGGKGGRGQDGAKGADGIKGIDGELSHPLWKLLQSDMGIGFFQQEYLLRGTNGLPGNDGGIGGNGGIGGLPGQVLLHGFVDGTIIPHIFTKKGSVGNVGKGGRGGLGGVHGVHNLYIVDSSQLRLSFEVFKKCKKEHSLGKAKNGTAGADGSAEIDANNRKSTGHHVKKFSIDVVKSVIKEFLVLFSKKIDCSPRHQYSERFLKLLSDPSLLENYK